MDHHQMSDNEIEKFRLDLLQYYDSHKRDMPWRTLVESTQEPNERAYIVWVSEIMLQQTQVATVTAYYNLWMSEWPTVASLSRTSLERVQEMWSGLGYYSRGRRLHEAARKVVNELCGKMPKSSEALQRELPGVGRYTACAIASIAFREHVGVVDGNVIRVFSRLRMIAADPSSISVNELMWDLANRSVDPLRPGDFNQALMELGATVCTPKSPACQKCPAQSICKSYQRTKLEKEKSKKIFSPANKQAVYVSSICGDIEDIVGCKFCVTEEDPWDSSLGVLNFPRKAKKKPPREEKFIVFVFEKTDGDNKLYLLKRRPNKGLLAGLLEFPMNLIESVDSDGTETLGNLLKEIGNMECDPPKFIGEIVHVFSHIRHTYKINTVAVNSSICHNDADDLHWMNEQQLLSAAISTGVRKIWTCFSKCKVDQKRNKRKRSSDENRKQRTIDSMFKKSAK